MYRLRVLQILVVVMSVMCYVAAWADTPENRRLMSIVNKALPGTRIESVSAAPVKGLIEVIAGGNVLYLEENGRYLVVGSLYDLQTRNDVTADRRDQLRQSIRIEWKSIPGESDAVIAGDEQEEQLAVLFDPLCSYCRKLFHTLQSMKGVSARYVMIAEQSGSIPVLQSVMCSEKPILALSKYYQQQPLASTDEDCARRVSQALKENVRFSKANNLRGTPVLISRDGRINHGAMETIALQNWVDKATGNTKLMNATNERGQ